MANGRKTILTVLGVLLMITLPGKVSGQHYLGIRGGYGAGDSRFFPKLETKLLMGLPSAGISWKYYSVERALGGVEVDLMYMKQGFKVDRSTTTNPYGYYQREYNGIMMPIFWQPHFYFFQQRMRVFVNAGVTFSYIIDAEEETQDSAGNVTSGDYKMYYTQDNHWGYGLCAGAGVGWAFGKWEAVAEFRYYIGYSDVMRNVNKNNNNPFEGRNLLRSPLDKMEVNIGVYYRLGNKGILSKPGPKMQRRIEAWEARRAEKGKGVKKDDSEVVKISRKKRRDMERASSPADDGTIPVSGEVIEEGAVRLSDGELIEATEPLPGVASPTGETRTPEEVIQNFEEEKHGDAGI